MNTSSHPSLRNPPELPVLGADRFEILERIGAGGMGTVYKAVQKSVGRLVAVKVLSSEYAANAAGVARFVREATVVSRLVHPNIVSMIEFGRDPEGNLLLVMELLEGEPLRQTLRRERRLPVWRAVQIAMQVLAALRVAHGAGVVHRDLKPENIFITHVDGADHAKVLDFGVAKMLSHEVGHETTAGSLVGTLKYMAPEQIAGDPPDARVDLYALGVLLYEMLAGTLPYEHKERVALLRAILNDPPVPLLHRAPEIPPELASLVMQSISKLTIDRFQSAEAFRGALAPFAMVGGDARPPAFPITQEIRLPIRAPTTDKGAHTHASTPSSISAKLRAAQESGDPSGAKLLHAPPPDPSGLSQSGAAPKPVEPSRLSTPSISASPAVDSNYTTGAGLSAATHRSSITGRKRSPALLVAGVATLTVVAASIGVLVARIGNRSATAPTGRERSTTSSSSAANQPGVGEPQGASTVHVMVQSNPAGAEVRDAISDELLCQRTPCMVPVSVGRTRTVRGAIAGVSIEVVLDHHNTSVILPLAQVGGGSMQTGNGATTPSVDAGVRGSGRPRGPQRPRGNEGSDRNGGIPMFGSRPGQ